MAEESDLYNQHPSGIVLYVAGWCPDCRRVRAWLDGRRILYTEVDAGKDRRAHDFLEQILRRVRLPAVFFPDGTMAVEPSDAELARRLPGERH
jgi:glutaredoxin